MDKVDHRAFGGQSDPLGVPAEARAAGRMRDVYAGQKTLEGDWAKSLPRSRHVAPERITLA